MEFIHTGQIPADLAQRSFAAGVALRMPGGMAPLFAMSGLAKKKTALAIEHGYWSKQYDYPALKLPVGVDIAAGDTTLELGTSEWEKPNMGIAPGNDVEGRALKARSSISDAQRLIPGMILRHLKTQTGGTIWTPPELMFVQSVDVAANVVTVVRGFAGTVAAKIDGGSIITMIGNAHEEGSSRPASQAVVPVRHVNLTHIFRNSWDVTGTMAAVALHQGVNAVANNKGDCAHMHARDIETATWFSRKSMSVRNGKPFHTMDGIEKMIENYAPENLHWAGATTNYDQLTAMVNPLLDWKTDMGGTNHRAIYAGGTAFQVLQDIGRKSGNYQIVDGQTNFGLQFKRFTTGRGTFDLIENPLFNTNPEWSKMAAVMDLGSFDYAYLSGRDTRHDQYNQMGGLTDGKDATGGVLTTELTIEMVAPNACGIIYNLSAAA